MKAYMVIDGQWGSTGKGLFCAYLAVNRSPDVAVCNFGPNAGHTLITKEESKIVLKQLPMAMIASSVKTILIGPGAIIDPEIFLEEIITYRRYLGDKRILIHPNAAIVYPEHKQVEAQTLARISSTAKGTGAAIANKVLRNDGAIASRCPYRLIRNLTTTHSVYMAWLTGAKLLQIESAQGVDLSVNFGHEYPYTTSRDITPAQILADTLVPIKNLEEVYMTLRTYPIRVGHQYNEVKEKIGDSGPFYPDQEEITWESLGQEAEITTVTGKIRRVFTFSNAQLEKVSEIVSPNGIFINFMNYLKGPKEEKNKFIKEKAAKAKVLLKNIWVGYGPKISDVARLEDICDE